MQESTAQEQPTAMSGFKLVPESERTNFLPSIAQHHYLNLENIYFNVLQKTVSGYSSGYHEFVEFPNGAKAVLFDLTEDEKSQVTGLMNYYNGQMTPRAYSLCAFILACNHLGHIQYENGAQSEANKLFDNFEKLMDVAYTHEMFADETTEIAGFLD